jgi:hypothetical protein
MKPSYAAASPLAVADQGDSSIDDLDRLVDPMTLPQL